MLENYSHINIYRDLAAIRQDDVFLYGSLEFIILTRQIFCFKRSLNNKNYLVLMNLSNQDLKLNLNYLSDRKIPKELDELVYYFGKNQTDTELLHKIYNNQTIKINTKQTFNLNARNCFIFKYYD